MTRPMEPQEVNAMMKWHPDPDTQAFRARFWKALENELLYGNPHGPVHGPTPKGILGETPEQT